MQARARKRSTDKIPPGFLSYSYTIGASPFALNSFTMPPVVRRLAAIAWPQPAAAGRLRAAAGLHTSSSFASRLSKPQNPLWKAQRKPQLLQAGHPRRRYYQSLDHPSEPPPQDRFSPDEQAILSAAYRHIPEHGFSDRTLALGTRDAGYPDISTSILPDGVFSLVRWHLVNQRTTLAARASTVLGDAAPIASLPSPLPSADVVDRAERLTWERLMGNKAVVGRWQEVCGRRQKDRSAATMTLC